MPKKKRNKRNIKKENPELTTSKILLTISILDLVKTILDKFF